jgi:hypothetical protein
MRTLERLWLLVRDAVEEPTHKMRAYLFTRRNPQVEESRRQLAKKMLEQVPEDERSGAESVIAEIRAAEMGHVVANLRKQVIALRRENAWLKARLAEERDRTPITARAFKIPKIS